MTTANDNNIVVKDKADMIGISLAYAPTSSRQLYQTIQVRRGTTLYQALEQVGWLDAYPDLATWCLSHKNITDSHNINKKSWRAGIYSVKQPLNYVLVEQDRIEVYRPLSLDPKKRRKVKAGN